MIGPAHDGGYWLIGSNVEIDELFVGIEWGTPHVATETIARIKASNLNLEMLPIRHDVDNASDLKFCSDELLDGI